MASPIHDAPPDPGSPRRSAFGAAVFVVWLALSLWGFWVFEARPLLAGAAEASQPERIRAVEAWGQAQGAGRGAPLLIHLAERSTSCACRQGTRDAATFAQTQQIRLIEAKAIAAAPIDGLLPSGAEWLLFASGGQLLYAGPEHSGDLCGAGGSLLLASLVDPDDPAFQLPYPILDADCGCSGSSGSSDA